MEAGKYYQNFQPQTLKTCYLYGEIQQTINNWNGKNIFQFHDGLWAVDCLFFRCS